VRGNPRRELHLAHDTRGGRLDRLGGPRLVGIEDQAERLESMSFRIGRGLSDMSKTRASISVSLDGYVAGPKETMENPLGENGERLHDWAVELKSWRELQGMEGGEENASSAVVAEDNANVGAEIMGRGKFGPPSRGPWGEDAWRGWWGDDPPFHKPVFVLTNHEREPLTLSDTTFTFVTDGIQAAHGLARQAAGDRDVLIGGGAKTINQFLAAGLVDQLDLHVVPIILGGGARLFEGVGPAVRLELAGVIDGPGVTHLRYHVSQEGT
jgi:dihydrofolate reductase